MLIFGRSKVKFLASVNPTLNPPAVRFMLLSNVNGVYPKVMPTCVGCQAPFFAANLLAALVSPPVILFDAFVNVGEPDTIEENNESICVALMATLPDSGSPSAAAYCTGK